MLNGADHAEVRWLSYEEAARVLGVRPESVERQARRKGWRRTKGNDGRARVGVPIELIPEQEPEAEAPVPDQSGLLLGMLAMAESQVAKAEARAEAAEARAAVADAGRLEAEIRAARAEGEAAVLREELARTRRGWREVFEDLRAALRRPR